jgi:hypothetical protein
MNEERWAGTRESLMRALSLRIFMLQFVIPNPE